MARGMLAVFVEALASFRSQIATPWSAHSLAAQAKSQTLDNPSRATPSAYQIVDSNEFCNGNMEPHARYWWTTSGFFLAILLEKAGYPKAAQYQLLTFIRTLTPSLGASLAPGTSPQWKSFMTDNHCPIELSWDWRTSGHLPKIRFSIEPVGVHAGTQLDPYNKFAAQEARETILRFLPETNMELLQHFQTQLNDEDINADSASPEGHLSREFYAFDLNHDGGIMTKAYLFPGYKANATEQTNFDITVDAINTAPDSTPEKLEALRVFQEYVSAAATPALEMDMLAIDLVQSAESRFKIYFRIRDTSFASIRNTMTLNRSQTGRIDRALDDLHRLYHAIGNPASDEDGALMARDTGSQVRVREHRTAGILYNAEFKYGSTTPKIKAYLPVRHFAHSEEAVISALEAHFEQTETCNMWKVSMRNYRDAAQMIL